MNQHAMSAAEFFDAYASRDFRYELVDGVPIMMASANACGWAPKRDPPLIQHRRLKSFKNAIFGGVPVGADRDPA